MKSRARAPTKVTLFGEHSVVYGFPAIVFSLPIYVEVNAEKHGKTSILTGPANLRTVDLVLSDNSIEVGESTKKYLLRYISYIKKSLELVKVEGVKIEIKSPLPVGAGLGTSAAVAVGTIAALAALKGIELDKEEIAKKAWTVEKEVQGRASPMDTAASALGGILWLERVEDEWRIERLTALEIKLVIGVFEKQKTTAELVQDVAARLERSYIYKEVIKVMGDIAREARKALENGDWTYLGELMNLNHSMLEALGVVNKEIALAVHAARVAGALGAKLSGAGSGGAVVALADDPTPVAAALKVVGAKDVFVVNKPSRGVEVNIF